MYDKGKLINLAPKRVSQSTADIRAIKNIKGRLPKILGIYIFVASIVLGVSMYLDFQLSKLAQTITNERNLIRELEKNEALYITLKQKASAVAKVVDSRFPYTDGLTYFKGVENQTTRITSLEMADGQPFSVRLDINDVVSVDRLISSLVAQAPEKFKKIAVEHLSYNKEANVFDLMILVERRPQATL